MERLSTPLYEGIVKTIVQNVKSKIPESEMMLAVREFFRLDGPTPVSEEFFFEEMWTALENVATSWVNQLDPEITMLEVEEDIQALSCSIALTAEQIEKFHDMIDSKTCLSDQDLIRGILWG